MLTKVPAAGRCKRLRWISLNSIHKKDRKKKIDEITKLAGYHRWNMRLFKPPQKEEFTRIDFLESVGIEIGSATRAEIVRSCSKPRIELDYDW